MKRSKRTSTQARRAPFKARKSLTKTWPGGRRQATIIHEVKDANGKEWSYPLWNKDSVPFQKPYRPPYKGQVRCQTSTPTTMTAKPVEEVSDAV